MSRDDRRALDSLPVGVLLVNAGREILYVNAAFTRMWKSPGSACRESQNEG
ncbi:PAS domain-containing protein [Rhizobium leguminosarum]|uniref:PAS domain-containing protein n=1 Tax=Rhizobium leguminosarum TaxID=384 RepID=UPI0019F2653E|nr:PAS domain-containing protein [Rhizobium leguminosarum bv. viciae]NKL85575.1 PAS domain-containing protein [Rhizobium leguminosarum bv. viciae]NKL89353.1 PAS domain-containing protein [Rhizobium leguminosarum bv. viciae]NKM90321.1 PAS domain-containing protein [Rhizobium leguminosarum bv. viciae]